MPKAALVKQYPRERARLELILRRVDGRLRTRRNIKLSSTNPVVIGSSQAQHGLLNEEQIKPEHCKVRIKDVSYDQKKNYVVLVKPVANANVYVQEGEGRIQVLKPGQERAFRFGETLFLKFEREFGFGCAFVLEDSEKCGIEVLEIDESDDGAVGGGDGSDDDVEFVRDVKGDDYDKDDDDDDDGMNRNRKKRGLENSSSSSKDKDDDDDGGISSTDCDSDDDVDDYLKSHTIIRKRKKKKILEQPLANDGDEDEENQVNLVMHTKKTSKAKYPSMRCSFFISGKCSLGDACTTDHAETGFPQGGGHQQYYEDRRKNVRSWSVNQLHKADPVTPTSSSDDEFLGKEKNENASYIAVKQEQEREKQVQPKVAIEKEVVVEEVVVEEENVFVRNKPSIKRIVLSSSDEDDDEEDIEDGFKMRGANHINDNNNKKKQSASKSSPLTEEVEVVNESSEVRVATKEKSRLKKEEETPLLRQQKQQKQKQRGGSILSLIEKGNRKDNMNALNVAKKKATFVMEKKRRVRDSSDDEDVAYDTAPENGENGLGFDDYQLEKKNNNKKKMKKNVYENDDDEEEVVPQTIVISSSDDDDDGDNAPEEEKEMQHPRPKYNNTESTKFVVNERKVEVVVKDEILSPEKVRKKNSIWDSVNRSNQLKSDTEKLENHGRNLADIQARLERIHREEEEEKRIFEEVEKQQRERQRREQEQQRERQQQQQQEQQQQERQRSDGVTMEVTITHGRMNEAFQKLKHFEENEFKDVTLKYQEAAKQHSKKIYQARTGPAMKTMNDLRTSLQQVHLHRAGLGLQYREAQQAYQAAVKRAEYIKEEKLREEEQEAKRQKDKNNITKKTTAETVISMDEKQWLEEKSAWEACFIAVDDDTAAIAAATADTNNTTTTNNNNNNEEIYRNVISKWSIRDLKQRGILMGADFSPCVEKSDYVDAIARRVTEIGFKQGFARLKRQKESIIDSLKRQKEALKRLQDSNAIDIEAEASARRLLTEAQNTVARWSKFADLRLFLVRCGVQVDGGDRGPCTQSLLKKAFKSAMMKFHPDRQRDKSERDKVLANEVTKFITHAWSNIPE